MSELAWRMLELFVEHTQKAYNGEYGRGYIAAWTLGEKMGGTASSINAIDTKINPQNEYQRALRELIDLGLVQELENLHERFRLVVKVPVKEEPTMKKESVVDYWTRGDKA